MTRTAFASLALLATLCSTLTASAQTRERFLDDGYLGVWLTTNPGPEGAPGTYGFNVRVRVLGAAIARADAVRIVWKQRGRTLAQQNCTLVPSTRSGEDFADVLCSLRDGTLTAVGPVQADVVYIDDNTDREVTLRTLELNVQTFFEWTGTTNRRPIFRTNYQIVDDGLLGQAYLWRSPEFGRTHGKLMIYFWGAQRDNDSRGDGASIRCSLDGTRIDRDLTQGRILHAEISITARAVTENRTEDQTWAWRRYALNTGLVFPIPGAAASGPVTETRYNVAEHPGSYMCELRVENRTVREFRFTVLPDGTLPLHAEQQGEGALHLRPDMSLIDVRIVNPDHWDISVQPDAIRRASFFGRPWRHPEAFVEAFRALPAAAVGRSVPPPPASMRSRAAPAVAPRGRRGRR